MILTFDLAGSQIDGARDYQEDAFLITNLADESGNPVALVIVADGMGGHAAGNVASNMAVQAFNKHVSANYPTNDPSKILYECVYKANDSIKETIKETPALSGMGCTIVAAILEKNRLWWASVGDSHLYLIRNNELIKKNADHSYGGFLDKMANSGTPVEPEEGLSRNMLMSALTGEEINEIDVSEVSLPLEEGDRVLICSDGLDTLSSGKIIQFSGWSESPKECAEALMKAVEEVGMPKQDNTTAVVVNVREKEDTTTNSGPLTSQAVLEQQIAQAKAVSGKKGKTGLVLTLLAVIIAAVAGGAYMMKEEGKPFSISAIMDAIKGKTAQSQTKPADTKTPQQRDKPITTEVTGSDKTTGDKTTEPEKTASQEQTVAAADTEKVAATEPETTVKGKSFKDKLTRGGLGPEMIWLPAREFDMGSSGASPHAEERPRHKVSIEKIAVSRYEITYAEYDLFASATGRRKPKTPSMDKKTHPVTYVTWEDAFYYTKWLSKQTGKKYNLPSEAEWEYAAGSGKRSSFWWGYNEEPGRAHCFGCETGLDPRQPTKVGSFKPNPFGIYDTAGNVAEWVRDCWHPNYKGAPTDGNVWEGGDCNYRITRGGAFSTPALSIRHAKRDKFKSDRTYDHIGFRVVRKP